MINDKQSVANILFDRTNDLLKSQPMNDETYFLPIGILLLKWLDDSKERFGWITHFSNSDPDINFSYTHIITICNTYSKLDSSGVIFSEVEFLTEKLEEFNPILNGIFTQLCFSGIWHVNPEYLREIVLIYNEFNFTDPDSDKYIAGPFIELFLQKLSDDLSSYAFITPISIKKILARLFYINENMNILDLTCGTGGILSQIINEYIYSNLDINTLNLYGQEINFKIALISKINLLFHGITNFKIDTKDSLKAPILNKNDYIENVDIILSNLPLGLKCSLNEIGYMNDFKYGVSKSMTADWLFIQRGLSSLNNNGRAAFIVSKGTLTRKIEKNIRESILKEDLVEAIISLPSSLYGPKSIPIEILIINKNKDNMLKNKVLFIDSSSYFYIKERGKNDISEEHIEKIIDTYSNYKEIDKYSKIIKFQDIENNNFELNSSLYINDLSTTLIDNNMKILSEVADIKRGLQLSKIDIENSEKIPKINTYNYIKISDINNDTIEIDKDKTEQIHNLTESKINSYELKPNDIIISARGTLIKIAMFKESMDKSIFSGNILLIRVKPNYNPHFLKFYLNSPKGHEIITSMQGGSTITSLNPNKLKEMPIPNITLDEQNILAERIKSNEETYKQRIEQAKKIYDQNISAINEEITYFTNY
jgi:type I restriction enzyme M protein